MFGTNHISQNKIDHYTSTHWAICPSSGHYDSGFMISLGEVKIEPFHFSWEYGRAQSSLC